MKYLTLKGLEHFWDKVKEWVNGKIRESEQYTDELITNRVDKMNEYDQKIYNLLFEYNTDQNKIILKATRSSEDDDEGIFYNTEAELNFEGNLKVTNYGLTTKNVISDPYICLYPGGMMLDQEFDIDHPETRIKRNIFIFSDSVMNPYYTTALTSLEPMYFTPDPAYRGFYIIDNFLDKTSSEGYPITLDVPFIHFSVDVSDYNKIDTFQILLLKTILNLNSDIKQLSNQINSQANE